LGEITDHCHRLHIKNGSFYFFLATLLPDAAVLSPRPTTTAIEHPLLLRLSCPTGPVAAVARHPHLPAPPASPSLPGARLPASPALAGARLSAGAGPRRS
jgi:hypothetical protein